jgi:hypothetical protein
MESEEQSTERKQRAEYGVIIIQRIVAWTEISTLTAQSMKSDALQIFTKLIKEYQDHKSSEKLNCNNKMSYNQIPGIIIKKQDYKSI